jgi:hypothetical protein
MKAARVATLFTIAALAAGPAATSAWSKGNAGGEPTSNATAAANPCKYVPLHNATAIFHAKVKETEAPLGPTCIFTIKGKKATDTLAVEVVNVAQTVHKMKNVSKFKLTGHQGYCGDLGTAQLFVKLRHQKVLVVHAPCKTARAIAGVAIRRIKT